MGHLCMWVCVVYLKRNIWSHIWKHVLATGIMKKISRKALLPICGKRLIVIYDDWNLTIFFKVSRGLNFHTWVKPKSTQIRKTRKICDETTFENAGIRTRELSISLASASTTVPLKHWKIDLLILYLGPMATQQYDASSIPGRCKLIVCGLVYMWERVGRKWRTVFACLTLTPGEGGGEVSVCYDVNMTSRLKAYNQPLVCTLAEKGGGVNCTMTSWWCHLV